jgi:pimeloyl-ACP methyl ester carboxylesterase
VRGAYCRIGATAVPSFILLHGLSDNRMGMIGYAELLLSHGYGVLMPDSRAHGQSGGTVATYGLLEKDAIEQWVVWVHARQHPRCVYGFGESMGAAQLLQTLELHPGLCAVAAESPFSNFREIAYDRVGQFFHGGSWIGRVLFRPTVEVALVYANWKYGFDFRRISPEDSVSKSQVPVFLIHGVIDRNIPVRHSERIRARNPRVMLWEVPNADHCGAISSDPDRFVVKLIAWFRAPVSLRSFANDEGPLF